MAINITYPLLPTATSIAGSELISADQSNVTSTFTPLTFKTFLGFVPLLPCINVKANLASQGAALTITADQLTLSAGLTSSASSFASVSLTNTLTTVGAGGIDTGTATANSYYAVYAIYNASTQTLSSLSTKVTSSTSAPEIYGGTHMPSGYTLSRLISTWTIGSVDNTWLAGNQIGRRVFMAETLYLMGGGGPMSVGPDSFPYTVTLTNIPLNAISWSGRVALISGQNSLVQPVWTIGPESTLSYATQITKGWADFPSPGLTYIASNIISDVPILTPQIVYVQTTIGSWLAFGAGFGVSSYLF